MTDTLRVVQLVDAIGHCSSLQQVCESLTKLPLFSVPFDAATLLRVDQAGALEVLAAVDPLGITRDLSGATLWTPDPLIRATALAHSSIVRSVVTPRGEGAEVWVLPLRSHRVPFGALMGWSYTSLPTESPSSAPELMLAAVAKSVMRAHEGRAGASVMTWTGRRAASR